MIEPLDAKFLRFHGERIVSRNLSLRVKVGCEMDGGSVSLGRVVGVIGDARIHNSRRTPMAADVVRMQLHLRRIRVLEVLTDTSVVLRVLVESTATRPRCRGWGFRCHRVHEVHERKVGDLDVSGRRTTLLWMRRRTICDDCGSCCFQDNGAFENKLTLRLADQRVANVQVTDALVLAWSHLIVKRHHPPVLFGAVHTA